MQTTVQKRPPMEEGKFYDLNPPIVVNYRAYRRVRCDYQVPGSLNEFAVSGIHASGL